MLQLSVPISFKQMEVEIIGAKESDQDRVFEFLAEHFYPDEPLNHALRGERKIVRENCASLGILKDGLSLIAVKKDDPVSIENLSLLSQ